MFFGCKKNTNEANNNVAYFGGEIINPNNDFVVLSKSESVIDTIKLDGRNRFMYEVKNLEEGLYTFKHGGEYQLVLLEINDSIMFRLNTFDFDESLVFTGLGGKKNNYLINEFLENEKNEKALYKFCQLEPKDYISRIDSISIAKTKKLNAFQDKYATSDLFNDIAKNNNTYSYYFSKEVYPLWHYSKNKQEFLKSIPDDFYNFRRNVNYNNENLKNNIIYNTFLKSSFSSMAFEKHFEHSDNNEKSHKRMSLCYNLDRLNLIDSLVENTYLKDELLYHFVVNYIPRSRNSENTDAILKSYLSKSKNEEAKEMMTRFTSAVKNLEEGSVIPNVKILDYNNTELDITSVINSPTVISFWSHAFYRHFKDSHYKIKDLKEKYPEVKFIVINIDDYGLEKPKKSLKNNRFSCSDEYYFKNPEGSIEVLAIHPMTKTMIIDKDKKIVNSNTNMFSNRFEEQLLGLINR